ncbi:hypothetical protein [Marivirga sp.]|uniref:hypothetical protein n=1 Tax=Marivirga sp. TaxID=2018662 RepID=UPI0025D210EE|nr:hypothetical protein [Marivirga sp.]
MKERKLFQEIPGGKNNFHSAVLTSFSFNFHHFEYQVLRTLRQKWITNISVLLDHQMLDGSIGMASGNLKQLSQTYSVNGIKSKGAFHPKINFLIGDNKLLLFFGSGNISPGGHGKNHELFTSFFAESEDSSHLPILQEAWDYLEGLTKDIPGYNKDRITKQIVRNSALLGKRKFPIHTFHPLDSDLEVALLYNDSNSILSQLISLIPADSITKLSIICPYYDENGATITTLADHFKNAIINIYLPAEFGLPPVNIPIEKRVNFFAWEYTTRGKMVLGGDSTYKRKLHSKFLHFEADSQKYLMLGSANATRAGFGTLDQRGVNDEFCALYKSSSIDFLAELGIKGKKKVNVKELDRPSFVTGDEAKAQNGNCKIFIKGADLRSNLLTVYLKPGFQNPSQKLKIYDSLGYEIYQFVIDEYKSEEFTRNLPSELIQKDLSFIEIVDSEGKSISNKQLINNLEKLFHTDPSKANRSINQVIYGLETGALNEFEILAYLNDLNHVKESKSKNQFKIGSKVINEEDSTRVEMTYDEAVEAAKNPLLREKIIRTHNSVRLWESISKLLLEKVQLRSDEIDDEEEEANAETSNDRKEKTPSIPSHPKEIKVEQLISQVENLVNSYKSSLNQIIYKPDHKIDIIDYAQFLLVSHILTTLTYFNDGEAFKTKNSDGYSDPNWQRKLRSVFKYQIKEVLTCFNKLLIKHGLKNSDNSNDKFSEQKLFDYKLKTLSNHMLYIYLIHSLNSETFIIEDLELLTFNLFERLGITESSFEQYLDNISKTDDEELFNVNGAINLRNKLEEKFNSLDENNSFFRIDHSGWCLVKEKNDKNIRYKSIHGTGKSSIPNYKKLKKRK